MGVKAYMDPGRGPQGGTLRFQVASSDRQRARMLNQLTLRSNIQLVLSHPTVSHWRVRSHEYLTSALCYAHMYKAMNIFYPEVRRVRVSL